MTFYRKVLEKLFPNNKRAIDQGLKRGDMFYLSSTGDKGPLVRKVIVLDIEGDVAELDQWDYQDRKWANATLVVDLARARYVGHCAPTPTDPVRGPESPAP